MNQENNPLKQYFRRPAIYVKLPSEGKYYNSATISMPDNKELPVFPMTAIDEITARTPDALFNGEAVADIIRSCMPNIKDPWAIVNMDLDAILIAIRTATNGNNMEIESMCSECSEESKYDVNLVGILAGLKPGNYDQELLIGELSIKFKPLTYKEINQINTNQFELQRGFAQLNDMTETEEKNSKIKELLILTTKLTSQAITSNIEYIKTPSAFVQEKEYILDFLNNCDKNTYDMLKEFNVKLKEGTDMKPLKVKCIHCQHEYDQPFTLNMSDFFG
jgi:hypothetical protein